MCVCVCVSKTQTKCHDMIILSTLINEQYSEYQMVLSVFKYDTKSSRMQGMAKEGLQLESPRSHSGSQWNE